MKTSPTIRTEVREGVATYVLEEPATGSRAVVVPEIGSNVLSFETSVGGRVLGVISPPPSIDALRERPSRFGTAVLFPYPGRVAGGRFAFRGQTYQLPPNDGGNAIHGPVRGRPWRVAEARAVADRGVLRTSIGTESQPDILAEWPFPFELSETVTLADGRLRVEIAATNTGDSAMPMGLGLHPYFATPVAGHGHRMNNLVGISAERLWTQKGGLPTGETTALDGSLLSEPRRLRELDGRPDADPERIVNLLYSAFDATRGLAPDAPGGVRATIADVDREYEIVVETSAAFGALVLFTSPTTTDLSLEPHTCTPNALNLASAGVDAGLVVLEPGRTWRAWAEFSARKR